MLRSPEPDPLRGVFRWARTKTGRYLGTYWVGVLVIGVASVFVSNTLGPPANPKVDQRIENGLIGVLIAAGSCFFWCLVTLC